MPPYASSVAVGKIPKFYQEREVIEAFLALPAAQRKVAREVVMALAVVAKAEKKPSEH